MWIIPLVINFKTWENMGIVVDKGGNSVDKQSLVVDKFRVNIPMGPCYCLMQRFLLTSLNLTAQ